MAQTPSVAAVSESASPAPAATGAQWPVQAADVIESVVTTIRDRSVGPLQAIARGVVYGLLAALISSVLFVLAAIAIVRAFVVYVPPHRVWVADLAIGGLFTLVGLILWSMRRPRRAKAP
jgi:hypothetical protein